MRTPDSLRRLAGEEIRVVLAPGARRGAPPERIAGLHRAEIGEPRQARHIGVVHEDRVAVTIDLVCPDRLAVRPLGQPVQPQRRLDLVRQRGRIRRQRRVGPGARREFRQLAQRTDREDVRRDQEREDARIVRRPEPAMDQPDRSRRRPIAVERHALADDRRRAAEAIRPRPVLALLLAERPDRRARTIGPQRIERRGVAGRLPIGVRDPHRVAE